MLRISILTLLAAALLGDRPAAALTQLPDPGAAVPLDPAIRAGRLDNGLRYFVRANARPENRAELMLVVDAGSVLEAEDQRGIAHVVEHMAFNGTRSFERQALVDWLESIGMRFGADLNAYTGFDETAFLITVPTDSDATLETGLQILEEWAHLVTFDSLEVERERAVIIEEWRLGQGAGTRLRDKVFPVLFRGSPYAERSPIGTRESLVSFDRDGLVRFYRDWYRPELMAVIAVGDFDAAAVEARIRRRFGAIAAAPVPRTRPVIRIPDHEEPAVVVATDPEATTATVSLYHLHDTRPLGTYGDFRRSLAEDLYNAMLNARLAERARTADPPFLGASSAAGGLVRARSAYSVGAAVAEDRLLPGLEAVVTEAARVARHGFTDSELEREKRELLRSYENAWAERDRTESSLLASEITRHVLEGEAVPGIAAEFELAKIYLALITRAEVNALASTWMTERNRVIVVQAPEKAGASPPAETDILEALAAVERKEIAPYTDLVSDDVLVPATPDPGRVFEERRHERTGILEWRLTNGARVLLRPTDFKQDEVLFRAFSPGGLSLVPDADYASGGFSTSLVTAAGIGTRDATQLQKTLAGKAVSVRPILDDLSEGITGGAAPGDLETMFQLIHLYFTAPRSDSVAFLSLLTRMRGFLENRQASPEAAFGDTLTVTLTQAHPRGRPVTTALLDEIDPVRAFAIYRDRFADAGDFTFAFVGSFDPDSIRPLVELWIGSLPATGRTETWRDSGIRPPVGIVTKEVRRGIEPRAETAIVFTGAFDWDIENAHRLRSLAESLDLRLRDVLREEMGGTYDVSVAQSAAREPWPHYALTISFGASPERVDSLAAVVFEEVARLRGAGPDSALLHKVAEGQRRAHETNLRQNGYWLSQIAAAALLGIEPGGFLDLPGRIDALTPERIAEAARTWLRPDHYVRVTLWPER